MNVFLHGGPGFTKDYMQGFFATTPDGFFFTQRSPIQSIDQAIDDLRQKIGSSQDVALVGHSWGGVLALEYVRRFGNVRALALLSVPLSHECETDFLNEKERLGLRELTLEQTFLSKSEMNSTPCLQAFHGIFATLDPASLQNLAYGYWDRFDVRPVVAQAQVPLMFVFGSEDLRVPARIQRQGAALNPRSQTLVIDGAGHFPFLLPEHRTQVQSALLGLLKN
jgi:pimeloyl-ACP methyl ester carboxylesterase